jgi:hypothetical protein
MSANPECTAGPHQWEFAGRGQRRCDICGKFGFVAGIRTEYRTKAALKKFVCPPDTQGVRYHLCKVTGCSEAAVGKDPLNAGHTRKQWRCGNHRTQYA